MGSRRVPDCSCTPAMWSLYICSSWSRNASSVDDLGDALAAETDHVGVEHLGPDPHLVHHLDPGHGVVGALVDVVDRPLEQALLGVDLRAVAPDHPAAAGPPEHGVAHHPGGHAVDVGDVGHAVAAGGRGLAGPQVVWFGQVRVGVDDPDLVVFAGHRRPPGLVDVTCAHPNPR